MGVTAVVENNAALTASAATFAISTLFEFIGCPHLDVFNQNGLISPNIDLHMKLIPSPNEFECKSAAPSKETQQENWKLVIQSANRINRTKKLTNTAQTVLINLLVLQNIMHDLSRVRMKHLSILAN